MWAAWHPQSLSDTQKWWVSDILPLYHYQKQEKGFVILKIKSASMLKLHGRPMDLFSFMMTGTWMALVTCSQFRSLVSFFQSELGRKNSKYPWNHPKTPQLVCHLFPGAHFTSKWPKDSPRGYVAPSSWYYESRLERQRNEWSKAA